ncbi:MAG: hypothetical protein H0X62_10425 [Bacteroidetes bacterium]|nr:hypothetical protein [Bacteroidota bacterium]
MTEKQVERIRKKIKQIRAALAEEKKKFGGYDDSRGLRYIPVELFISISDYKGGLTYLRWFNKNFSDDIGFPGFLFEWVLILFKTGKLKDAEKKAFDTFCSNTYVFDFFLKRDIEPIDKQESFSFEAAEFAKRLPYSSEQPELSDFAEWLIKLLQSGKFSKSAEKFIEIQKRLLHENDRETRHYLIKQKEQLIENYSNNTVIANGD